MDNYSLTWIWFRTQLDQAGFPPSLATCTVSNSPTTIWGQLNLMGDRGF